MNYKMVIFDFDGTLSDSFPWFAANFNHAAKLFRFRQINESELEVLRNYTAHEVLKYLNISWWKIPLVSIYMRMLMSRSLSQVKLFKDTDVVLTSLKKKKVKVAIVSSNSEFNVRSILGPLADEIDYFKCGSSLFGKPKKFKALLKETTFLPHEVLCIGDEVRDIEAAKANAMYTGSVIWGYAHPDTLREKRPDYLFSTMMDIDKIF